MAHQHSHSIKVVAFQKLVLGSTALHFLPSVSISAAPSLLLPASFGWASLCMTSQAPARAVARTVKSWATTAWSAAPVVSASCGMASMTRQPLLASRHSRSVVLFSQETTGVPTDAFLPHWAGGLDAALDVTVTHPLQDATRARAATTPGHAMTVAYENKCRIAEELCREKEIAFIPVVAESLGGWHQVALDQFRKLGSALARHTGQDEREKVDARYS